VTPIRFQKIISTGSVAAYVVAHAKQSVLVIKK
jgi:nucleotide-binding universal stress UspA family protein